MRVRDPSYELFMAMTQLQLIAIDSSAVNLSEKVSLMREISKAFGPLTLKTVTFICNLTCVITAVISFHYHAFSQICMYNLIILSQSYVHFYLWIVRKMTCHLTV